MDETTPPQRLYAFVDENGMETQGVIFIVSVIITEDSPQALLLICEEIEKLAAKVSKNGVKRLSKDVWITCAVFLMYRR